jgi:hypothetical protein
MTLISTSEDLSAVCRRLAPTLVTVDTEFCGNDLLAASLPRNSRRKKKPWAVDDG